MEGVLPSVVHSGDSLLERNTNVIIPGNGRGLVACSSLRGQSVRKKHKINVIIIGNIALFVEAIEPNEWRQISAIKRCSWSMW